MHATKTFALTAVAVLLALGSATSALAQSNTAVGLWRVTAFNDLSPDLRFVGTHEICIRPDRTWHARTLPGWGGFWFQKGLDPAGNGNHVALIGNFTVASGHVNDSVELDFVNSDLMTGTWRDWRDGFVVIIWLRTNFTRVARECDAAQAPSPGAAAAPDVHSPWGEQPKP